MNFFTQWLHKQGLEIVTQPLSRQVVGTQDAYIHSEGLTKLGWRVIRRKIYLLLSGQRGLMREKADPRWTRGLWIYFRTAQIGDSLMDLAARDFFHQIGCTVDLLTHEKLANLYEGDEWFGQVTADVNTLNPEAYDFIIVQSVHHRALNAKIKFFKSKPWLCMQGFYDVPDFARAPWGAQRLLDFWSWSERSNAEDLGIQKLSHRRLVSAGKKYTDMTIVLGGMDPVRTYPYWFKVLQFLDHVTHQQILLIGTGQAADEAASAILDHGKNLKISNKVNQLSLSECINELAHSKLLLVADGGAMHLGVAVNVPRMIALFIKEIPPELRIPNFYRGLAVVSKTGFIKDIAPEDIAQKVNLVLNDGAA